VPADSSKLQAQSLRIRSIFEGCAVRDMRFEVRVTECVIRFLGCVLRTAGCLQVADLLVGGH